MRITIITPPEPFLTPADIAGDHAEDDPAVAALIAAATQEIDGNSGWLGRCLGPQLVEWSGRIECRRLELPLGPVLEIEEIVTEDDEGMQTEIDPASYRLSDGQVIVASGAFWVSEPVHRVRYWAGYGTRNQEDPATWDELVPERVKVAVTMSVQQLIASAAADAAVRSEVVEGVGTTSYFDAQQTADLVTDAARRLIEGLKVVRI